MSTWLIGRWWSTIAPRSARAMPERVPAGHTLLGGAVSVLRSIPRPAFVYSAFEAEPARRTIPAPPGIVRGCGLDRTLHSGDSEPWHVPVPDEGRTRARNGPPATAAALDARTRKRVSRWDGIAEEHHRAAQRPWWPAGTRPACAGGARRWCRPPWHDHAQVDMGAGKRRTYAASG